MSRRSRAALTAYRPGLAEPFDYVPKGLERGSWISTDGTRCSGYRWNEFLLIADTDTKGGAVWVVADHRTGKALTWSHSLTIALLRATWLDTPRVAGEG